MKDSPLFWQLPPAHLSLSADEVHVWRAALDLDGTRLQCLHGLLATDECTRAERFHFQVHRRRFIAARGLLRVLLAHYLGIGPAELQFGCNPYGKPCLSAEGDAGRLRFNVSHCEDLALFAFTREREVGLDLERIRPGPADEQIAERFFSPTEIATLRALPKELQPEGFFNCWTRKEAYLKARGTGLAVPLDQFDVSLAPGEPATLLSTREEPEAASRWSLQALTPDPAYAAALAVEGRGWRLQCWWWLA